ncbi:MAG TPA: phosphate ABC transporter permease subunit PstC, partial [Blastocatellia bacterium]|nr:phosphate ABC transporter permease subunit PstC [Blastocatellia bacterium]
MEPLVTQETMSAGGVALSPKPDVRLASGKRIRIGDLVFKSTTFAAALGISGLVLIIIVSMAKNSSLSFAKFGWRFLWTSTWDPVHDLFGALPFIYGTVVSSIIALLLAVPVSIGIAVFLVEHSPKKLATPTSFLVQLLAAIPSVVYGMWGIFVLAPVLRVYVYPPIQKVLGFLPIFKGNAHSGLGLLTAGIILSIMIIPIITAVSTDVLRAVPGSQREASLALGATVWEATQVV